MGWIFAPLIFGLVMLALPAEAGKTVCRPTFDGFMEFECETKDPPVGAASF